MDKLVEFAGRHIFLVIALVAVIILLILEEKKGGTKGLKKTNPQHAIKLINHDKAKILDLRTVEEFKIGHIVDTINIPATELLTKINKLNKHKTVPLILIAATDQQAARSGLQLKQQGFTQLYVLARGLAAWQQAGLPLSKN